MSLRTAGTAYFHYLTGNKEHHWWDWPALLLLSGASWIYRKAVIMKYRSFADHQERQERLPAVVISFRQYYRRRDGEDAHGLYAGQRTFRQRLARGTPQSRLSLETGKERRFGHVRRPHGTPYG